MGDIVAAESDVVTLTPVIVLYAISNLSTNPAPTLMVDSDMVLYKPNRLETESDIEMDSDNVLYVDINLVTVSLTSNIPPGIVSNFTGSNRSFVESNSVFFSNMSTVYLFTISNSGSLESPGSKRSLLAPVGVSGSKSCVYGTD